MKNNNVKHNGFALFAVLIAVTLVTIVGVIAFVMMKKPKAISTLPSQYVAPIKMDTEANTTTIPTSQPSTPMPTVSSSTDIQVIGKEIDDTKVNSVDADFNAMESSASSL